VLVGVAGFEPATPSSRTRCAIKLCRGAAIPPSDLRLNVITGNNIIQKGLAFARERSGTVTSPSRLDATRWAPRAWIEGARSAGDGPGRTALSGAVGEEPRRSAEFRIRDCGLRELTLEWNGWMGLGALQIIDLSAYDPDDQPKAALNALGDAPRGRLRAVWPDALRRLAEGPTICR
jgi:hypothetical protein